MESSLWNRESRLLLVQGWSEEDLEKGSQYRILWHPTNADVFVVTGGPHNENVFLVSISAVLEQHPTGHIDSPPSFWNGAGVVPLKWHNAVVNDIAFSPDGTCLASCSDDGHVVLWSTDEKVLVRDFIPFQNNPVSSVAFYLPKALVSLFFLSFFLFFFSSVFFLSSNPQAFSPVLLTGGPNNRIFKLWNTTTWMTLQTIDLHSASVSSFSLFSFFLFHNINNRSL